jgi:hypothetical protein
MPPHQHKATIHHYLHNSVPVLVPLLSVLSHHAVVIQEFINGTHSSPPPSKQPHNSPHMHANAHTHTSTQPCHPPPLSHTHQPTNATVISQGPAPVLVPLLSIRRHHAVVVQFVDNHNQLDNTQRLGQLHEQGTTTGKGVVSKQSVVGCYIEHGPFEEPT